MATFDYGYRKKWLTHTELFPIAQEFHILHKGTYAPGLHMGY